MDKGKIKPLADIVLIEPQQIKKKTTEGIYLPETSSQDSPQEGKVAAVGGDKNIKVKKGQLVIFRHYSGTEIKINDKKYILIKNEDILAIVE